jgi:hypothetical protein
MDSIRRRISHLGVFIALSAIVSAVLQIAGYELRALRALHEQPALVAWGIRLAMLVVGVALFLAGPKDEEPSESAAPPTREALAQDPRVQWLLGWVAHNMGATLNAAPGSPSVAHIAFWDARSVPSSPSDPAAAQVVAYVDNFQQGRWCVVSPVGSQQAQPAPVSAAGWAHNVPSAS